MSAKKRTASKTSGKKSSRPTRRVSPVSAEAQRAIYQALCRMPTSFEQAQGAEIAEAAVCLAAGDRIPVIAVGEAPGARLVRPDVIQAPPAPLQMIAAMLTTVAAMIPRADASGAILCAGELGSHPTAQQDWRSVFRFAALHKLPILFVVASRYDSPQPEMPELRTLDAEFGLPVFTVDANDAVAAYRVATEALHQIRHHRGPSLLEALSVVPDDPGAASSPLEILTAYMHRHGNPAP
jgi:hypothetical protein